jgi:hypothetical protein
MGAPVAPSGIFPNGMGAPILPPNFIPHEKWLLFCAEIKFAETRKSKIIVIFLTIIIVIRS